MTILALISRSKMDVCLVPYTTSHQNFNIFVAHNKPVSKKVFFKFWQGWSYLKLGKKDLSKFLFDLF